MSQVLFGDDVRFKNGVVYPVSNASTTPYNISNTSGPNGGNEYAVVVTNSSAFTVNLPSDTNGLENGRKYEIIAGTGNTVPNITVDGGPHTINGAETVTITQARNTLTLMFTNATSEWHII